MTSRSATFASVFEKAQESKKKKRKRPVDSRDHPVAESKDATQHQQPLRKKKQRPPKKKHGNITSRANYDQDANNRQAKQRPAKNKKPKLSPQAVELSAQLKESCQHKNLELALRLYWNADATIRDEYHACVAMDCCARCGALPEMERILSQQQQQLKGKETILRVETMTTAIKGYGLAGDMTKATRLFQSMLTAKSKQAQPNTRTLNTLLRGCLWTAATIPEHVDPNAMATLGGVITSEAMWQTFQQFMLAHNNNQKNQKEHIITLNVSAFEYSIALLCQDLRMLAAQQRIDACLQQFANHPDVLETMAISYASMARAKAMLGDIQGALEACREARKTIGKTTALQCHVQGVNGNQPQAGGKQGWKGSSTSNESRTVSNAVYRKHRLSEVEMQLQAMEETCRSKTLPDDIMLAKHMLNGLFYFSGGGVTQASSNNNDHDNAQTQPPNATDDPPTKGVGRLVRRGVVNALWLSFGFKAALQKAHVDWIKPSADFIRVKESERIYRTLSSGKAVILEDGSMDFRQQPDVPIDVELGSGHGDWIVHQAHAFSDRYHVAVEMRADRVHQIFCKGFLHGPLSNLAVVGDDSQSFLKRLVSKSVANIFVNHPEPPTQVHGKSDKDLQTIMEGGPEPAHMLNSETLLAARNCLQNASSRIIIVTDNLFYGRLLCATVVKINRNNNASSGFVSLDPGGLETVETLDNVRLLQGQPSPSIGHAAAGKGKGSSYFDRLWRTGAGAHASKIERYILVLAVHQK
jgi:pentatricopeptide repeat protein